ncbi:hypothetical protein FRX31_015959 [Thalictrum thalictroides]|uniref:Uncharacterized protein n=1 Tax=Thalictrum thalictroides TaxID=46969 RepID=A0A7J6WBX3_THATH|nr:hypothetical protein FRX31_015959 [Thalictrum thalictroides]
MVFSPLRFEEALRHGEMIQGRNQKPKGFNVKHALQVTLLLVIGIWLLYQVKNSHHNKKDYSATLGNKVANVDMGRKGNAGGSNDQVDMDFRDGNSSNGDDELVKKSEGTEPLGREDIHKKVLDNEVEEDAELGQPKETPTYEEVETVESEKAKEPHKPTPNENAADLNESDNENDLKKPDNFVANTEGLNSENDEESKDSAEEIRADPDETESSSITITGTQENIREVTGYQDENGIPPGGHESENNLYNETISDVEPVTTVEVKGLGSDDQSEEADTNKVTDDAEEVNNSAQNNGQNDSEMPSHDLSIEEEVSSEFADKYEKLNKNGTAEMTQEGSNSDLSQHEVEETDESEE